MRLLDALRASPQRAAIAVSGDLSMLCVRRVCASAEIAASLEDGCGWEVLASGEPLLRATLVEINAIMARMPGGKLDWQPIDIGDHGAAETDPNPDVETLVRGATVG